ncbi:MAG: ATP-binding protein [bacterium]
MRLSINRLLKFNIRGKLAIAFAGLSILPVMVVGILGIASNIQSLRQIAIENLHYDLLTIKERLDAFFQGMEDNIHFLTTSASFQRFIDGVNKHDGRTISLATAELLPEWMDFAQRKAIFYQIKFIDREGNEIFAIEHRQGQYSVLPAEELNKTGTYFYLYLAHEIPPNKATFIPIELKSSKSGELLPAISCIYLVYAPEFSGILIFQIYAQSFFKIVEQATPQIPSGTVMLVNADGYYLYHSEKKKDWNQLLATKEILNLKSDYGEKIAPHLLSRSSNPIYEIDGELVAHAPLFSDRMRLDYKYTILKSVSKAEIFASVGSFKRLFVGLLGFFLLASLILAYLATRQFTGPIQRLKREAEVIAKGEYHGRVDVHTYDEIEELAHQFNIMAKSLEQREAEIAQHRKHLEQMVQARTRELEKEKNKLQVILDHVPSGLILVDKDFNILSASAAIKSIIGKPLEKVIGCLCYEITGCTKDRSICPIQRVFCSGKMESQFLHRVGPDGEERYLEQTAVPLKKDGRVETVLEIITDVTERKRLQDQLVRSEKLATTGEIAAVIAHEVRNSLTSVRMIMQLLNETERLNVSDHESLEVALDSLSRMENVVADLLQLARPAQLEKKLESINDILQDSIEFVEHQISGKGIELDVKLEPGLPDIELDREHLKEAMVNLILNASQAIEISGSICIHSRLNTLNKTLRDLGEVRVAAEENVVVGVQEVVLEKGRQVVRVEVRDSGCGIPEEHLKRIFDPFFTTKVNGTGLGLSFVKRVVNEHGGIVTAESQLGKGSCFTIYIPV